MLGTQAPRYAHLSGPIHMFCGEDQKVANPIDLLSHACYSRREIYECYAKFRMYGNYTGDGEIECFKECPRAFEDEEVSHCSHPTV